MGRWKRGKRQNKDNQKEKKRPKIEGQTWSWTKYTKENKAFEEYYKAQDVVPDSEWDDFIATLRRDLPSTFRITGSKSDAQDLANRFKDLVSKMKSDEDEEIRNNAPTPLKWYPDQLAWETKAAKRTLRKSPLYEDFHNFLVEETNCGAISRQEAVSMIPPLMLDVKSHHNVLDMCAAPGSKTSQLIEMMQDGAENGIPSGILIANDADNKRCYMLVHQSKRLTTPGLIVTNHDARVFPSLVSKEHSTGTSVPLRFDRILCDVPCSGDGTMRKNPLIWNRWKPGLGYPLHRMQLRIVHRGLEILKEGGRLVYSTCTLNPIENEAVIAAILKRCQGTVHLVDMSQEFPDLKRRSGLLSWKVFSKSGQEHMSYEEIANSPVSYYRATMFCPSLEEAKELHLERCMRVLPHMQDTGGFFIAVLQKNSKLPWQSSSSKEKRSEKETSFTNETEVGDQENKDVVPDDSKEDGGLELAVETLADDEALVAEDFDDPDTEPAIEESSPNGGTTEGKTDSSKSTTNEHKGFKEDPYVFLTDDDEDVQKIRKHYSMDASFPVNQLLVRTAEGKRRHVYVVSRMVKDIVEKNREKLKVINTGIKAFSRLGLKVSQEIGCDFRLTQEGLHVTRNFINAKVVNISRQDLQLLLTEEEPFITRLTDQCQEQVNKCSAGCIVWNYSPETSSDTDSYVNVTSSLWLCGHKGKASVRCMLAKQERLHYMRIVGIAKKVEQSNESESKAENEDTESKTVESGEDGTVPKVDDVEE